MRRGRPQTNAHSLANLHRGCTREGPSPFALAVIRRLIHVPMTVIQLELATGLSARTVRAQIEYLLKSQACRRVRFIPPGYRSGAQAVYRAEVVPVD